MNTYDIIKRFGFGRYLEIGVQEGNSINAASRCERITSCVGVDDWGVNYGGTGRGSQDHVLDLLGDNAKKVTLITGNSHEVIPKLRGPFDTIFVDGDHSDDGALLDLEGCLKILSSDGVIIFDDVDHPLHPYLRNVGINFAKANNLTCEYFDAHMGVFVFRREHGKTVA